MIMRNHGLLVCGSSVGDAFHWLWRLERVCQTQVMAMASGARLLVPDSSDCECIYQKIQKNSTRATAGEATYVSPWLAMLRKLEKMDPTSKE
jgi:ribulose-5-phosphate 4-epimerase/fuculose-1-phosphate aldolase